MTSRRLCGLFIVLNWALMSCTISRGAHQFTGNETVEHTAPSVDYELRVDDTDRLRIRLLLSKRESSERTRSYDVAVERTTQLSWKASFLIGAGVAALSALAGSVAFVLTRPPAGPGPNTSDKGQGVLLASAVIGASTLFGLSAGLASSQPFRIAPSLEHERVVTRLVTRGRASGALRANGLPPSGRAVVDGVIEVSLDEGAKLSEGPFFLDGQQVALPENEMARLTALQSCRIALADLTPAQPDESSLRDLEPRFTAAEACDRAGWGFADELLAQRARVLHPNDAQKNEIPVRIKLSPGAAHN